MVEEETGTRQKEANFQQNIFDNPRVVDNQKEILGWRKDKPSCS